MKALRIDANFLLAPDFEGGIAAALRSLADFLDAEQEPPDHPALSFTVSWDSFRWNVQHCGARVTGKFRIDVLSDSGWKSVPDGVRQALRDGQTCCLIK